MSVKNKRLGQIDNRGSDQIGLYRTLWNSDFEWKAIEEFGRRGLIQYSFKSIILAIVLIID